MDNAGDWLYIVFLVVAAISGIFSSKNKKKDRPDILGQPGKEIVPDDQPSKGKGFWEILEEMQNPSPKPQSQPLTQAKPKKQKMETAKAVSVPSPFLSSEKGIPNRITPTSSTISIVEEETGILPDNPFRDMGELKKAVIYAEILNRKY